MSWTREVELADGEAARVLKSYGLLDHLTAEHNHFLFKDPRVRSVMFTNPFASGLDPTAEVQALFKTKGSGWTPIEIHISWLTLDGHEMETTAAHPCAT